MSVIRINKTKDERRETQARARAKQRNGSPSVKVMLCCALLK